MRSGSQGKLDTQQPQVFGEIRTRMCLRSSLCRPRGHLSGHRCRRVRPLRARLATRRLPSQQQTRVRHARIPRRMQKHGKACVRPTPCLDSKPSLPRKARRQDRHHVVPEQTSLRRRLGPGPSNKRQRHRLGPGGVSSLLRQWGTSSRPRANITLRRGLVPLPMTIRLPITARPLRRRLRTTKPRMRSSTSPSLLLVSARPTRPILERGRRCIQESVARAA